MSWTLKRASTFAVAATVMAAIAGLSAQKPRSGFRGLMVGFVTADAKLVPTAVFDGRSWGDLWKAQERPAEPPTTLRDIPAARWRGWRPALRWELMAADGTPRTIHVRGVTSSPSCSNDVDASLATDLPPATGSADPDGGCPEPLAGMAASQPDLLKPVSRLPLSGPDAAELTLLLPSLFRRIEPRLWDGQFEDERRGARRPPPTLDDAFAAALPHDRTILLFHARQPIPGIPTEPVTMVTGWCVRHGSSPCRIVSAFGSQTDLDGKGGDDMLVPLAHLTIDERTFWMGSTYGYESEGFRVVEVTDARPRRLLDLFLGGA